MLTGTDKGKKGKVLKAMPSENKVVVEGVNQKNKRQKPRKQGEKGQLIKITHPVNVSNVGLFCGSCGKGVRAKVKMIKDKKTRVCAKCGKEL
ncbi:MAG: 50S ribosomal protein L24 [Parcubacteria group bacterium GW2011_GWC1_43_11b]|nr:MAG: 50S ribosomal protein L24 [Parcubacteria group bacterium GW2011_GWB1_42_9]KKS87934.1 MAG: 50S ribosomal protein L24 [Parcubacteria group bacterium GW2011_GWC1_43_11b]KKT09746.1 MAG: 50S ribosomal protein L24 [Parcubacteria group bacterium GW2011_GWA1_43_21]